MALMGQVAQTDSLHQQVKIKDATIERLEAEVKRLGANDQRDSRGDLPADEGLPRL